MSGKSEHLEEHDYAYYNNRH